MTETLLAIVITMMWLGVALWVYFDARRRGKSAWSNAAAAFLFPGLGIAVYMGTRGAEEKDGDSSLDPLGQRLLEQLTAEVERLRLRVAELEAELHDQTSA